jgi:hypothetical protein
MRRRREPELLGSSHDPGLAVALSERSGGATLRREPPGALPDKVYNGRMGNRIGTDDGWNFRSRGASQAGRSIKECGAADFILGGCLTCAQHDDFLNVTIINF